MLGPKWTPKAPKSAPPTTRPATRPPFASSSSSISTPSSPAFGADFVLEVRDDRKRISRSRTISNSSVSSASIGLSTAQVTRFGLGFERGIRIFEAGEVIHGHVLLSLSGPLIVRRIRVQLEGRAHLLQAPTAPEVASKDVRMDRERFLFATCTPFGSDLDYAFYTTDGNFILRPGDYEFHFELPLDFNALPSVDAAPVFTIAYECSAHIECGPKHERLITCNCNLKVTRHIDLGHLGDRMLPTHFSKIIRLSDVLPSHVLSDPEDGFIDIDFGLNSGVATCGMALRLAGQVVNRAGLRVSSVTAAIIQRVALRLPSSSSHRSSTSTSSSLSLSGFDETESEEWAEAVVTSEDFGAIDIGSHLTLKDAVLKLPPEHVAMPATRDAQRSFRCEYCVRVKVNFQAEKQLHMISFDSPLAVGHSVSGSVPLSPTILSDDVF